MSHRPPLMAGNGSGWIVFKPTGPYHKAFEATLGETFPMVKVNPLQARRCA